MNASKENAQKALKFVEELSEYLYNPDPTINSTVWKDLQFLKEFLYKAINQLPTEKVFTGLAKPSIKK